MKFSRMEKMPTRPSQESNLGLQQTRLVLYKLSYRDQAQSPTIPGWDVLAFFPSS